MLMSVQKDKTSARAPTTDTKWALSIRPKISKCFLGKVPENREIVEFPKSEPFNRKFRKFRDESQMERKFQ